MGARAVYEEPKRSQMRDALEYAAVLVLLLGSQTGCGQAGDEGQPAEAPAAMTEVEGQADVAAASELLAPTRLEGGLEGEHRSEENRARDVYRHPVDTLGFLGIEPDMVVVEISPGGGWYTEILAPLLRDEGTFYAAGADPESESEYAQRSAKRFADKLAAQPEVYDRTIVTVLAPSKREIAPRAFATAYWPLLTWHVARSAIEPVIGRLALTRRQADAVRALPALHGRAPRPGARPSETASLFADLPAAAVWALAAAGSGAAREQAHAYMARHRTVRPLLRGDDLPALGVPPGKAVGEVLTRLRAAKLDGEVRTRADEERLVRDGLSRNNE